jgi:DNA repair exonuclease SbcCD ATPase subunit
MLCPICRRCPIFAAADLENRPPDRIVGLRRGWLGTPGMAFRKTSFMIETSVMPETTPDVAEIASFLRRFADLLGNGHNATYLHRASELLETLTARVIAASDEEQLWRYKYETLTRHTDALRNDVEGHLDITSSVLAERDALGATLQATEAELSGLRDDLSREREERAAKSAAHEEALTGLRVAFDQKREALEVQAAECDELRRALERERDGGVAKLAEREAELSGLRNDLSREREERAAKSAAHEEVLAGLRAAFDQKREALQATLEAQATECDELRRALERERDDGVAKLATREAELSELRLAFDRERGELQAQLKARGDDIAVLRMVSEREHDALKEKVTALETKRAELRSAFDRISLLGTQTIAPQERAERLVAEKPGLGAQENLIQRRVANDAAGAASAVVPKSTLLQARAQFEYLAREFIPLGDIASQVMCELGAYAMDLALVEDQSADHLPVGEVARSILAPLGPGQT